MGKIDDILFEINQFISGDDWSETLQIRKAVSAYTQACCEVSEKLAECRKLIEKDLLLDAQRINVEITPSLTERATKLYLHGLKYERLTQLCAMYNYSVPPLIDMDTVKKLRTGNTDTAMNALILRWRKIARGHDNQAKVDLLREILANNPADAKMWESNLANIEQKYALEIQAAAEKAIADGDNKKVVEYYNMLTSDQWLTSPENIASQLRPVVQAYKQEMFNGAIEHKLNDLFTAYSIMDSAMIRTLLKEYEAMTRNKLYRHDPQTERAVDDVRKFLRDNEAAKKQQQEFDQKKNTLIAMLDQHGDFDKIENLYEALRRIDLPLEDSLSTRVANRRAEHIAEINRRHTRKCVYCVMGVLVLIGIVAIALITIQSYRTYRSYFTQMTELQKNGNHEGVMKLYAEVKTNSPLALRFGNLDRINLESERQHKTQLERNKVLESLLAQGEKELKKEEPSLELLKSIAVDAGQFKNDPLPAALAKRYRDFTNRLKIAEQQAQNKLENEFEDKITPLLNLLKKYCADIRTVPDLEQLEQDIINTLGKAQAVIDEYQSKIPEFVKSYQDLLKSRSEELNRELKNYSRLRSTLRALTAPADAETYLKALKDLPQKAPMLANGAWKSAVANQPQWEALLVSISLFRQYGSNPDMMSIQFMQNKFTPDNNIVAADYVFLESTNVSNDKIAEKLSAIERKLSAKFNVYELIFTSADGKIWRFYSSKAPDFDRGNNSAQFDEINMDFQTGGDETVFITFNIKSKDLFVVDADYPYLPKQFIKLNNHNLSSRETPKARHYETFKMIIKDLRELNSPREAEKFILQHLDLLAKDDLMNPFARAELVYHLLDLLAVCAPLHSQSCKAMRSSLESIALITFNKWQAPDAIIKYQKQLLGINKFFETFSIEPFRENGEIIRSIYRKALSRNLLPAGIVMKNGSQTTVRYFNSIGKLNELWFYKADKKQSGWIVVPGNAIGKDNSLKQTLIDLPNGTIFFTPVDGQNTADLATDIKTDLKNKNIKLQQWPASWPLNIR